MLRVPVKAIPARVPDVVSTYSQARAEVDEWTVQYVVRFDGPIDHRRSRLFITRAGSPVQELRPLLDAAPEVLFGSARRLPAGQYELHWEVRSLAGGAKDSAGLVPFRIRP